MTGRIRRMFGESGFAVLVVLVGVLVFGPFPESFRAMGEFALFLYFFTAWAGAILLAFLISRAVIDSDARTGNDGA